MRWAARRPSLRLRRADGRGRRRAPRVPVAVRSRRPAFLHPPDMPAAIARVLPADRAAGAGSAGGVHARDPREPRVQVPRGARVARGADRHAASTRSRSSAAARATGCSTSSPPMRPAARARRAGRGDRARQHRDADAGDRRASARWPRRARIIERSFPVERFEPVAADRWDAHYRRFQDYVEMTCV